MRGSVPVLAIEAFVPVARVVLLTTVAEFLDIMLLWVVAPRDVTFVLDAVVLGIVAVRVAVFVPEFLELCVC